MASNQLTKEEKDNITTHINALLGRGVEFLKFPLEEEHLLSIVRARVDEELLQAVRVVVKAKMSLNITTRVVFPYSPPHYALVNINAALPKPMVRYPAWETPQLSQMEPFTLSEVADLCGEDTAKAFHSWVDDVTQFSREATSARKVIEEIVDMASTPGQLRRMVPDLIEFLSRSTQLRLKEQVRASSMPFEWAAYPREPLYAATTTISKCYLLPESKKSWDARFSGTWVN